jgi:uncharacterized membrane protein YhaH (DUF805 family)
VADMSYDFAWYFLSFKGRISRQEFWLGYFAVVIILLLVRRPLEDLSIYFLRPMGRPWYRDELLLALGLPKLVAGAIMIWPLAAISVKRLHDFNFSAWWLPVFWVGSIILGFIPGNRGSNRFGADPLAHTRTNDG